MSSPIARSRHVGFATRLAALEERLDETNQAVAAMGAMIASELNIESTGPIERIIEKADALTRLYAEDGKAEAARLMGTFHQSIKKPWSFFDWLATKF